MPLGQDENAAPGMDAACQAASATEISVSDATIGRHPTIVAVITKKKLLVLFLLRAAGAEYGTHFCLRQMPGIKRSKIGNIQ